MPTANLFWALHRRRIGRRGLLNLVEPSSVIYGSYLLGAAGISARIAAAPRHPRDAIPFGVS